MTEDVDIGGPTLEEAQAAAALASPEPDEDTAELPVDVRDGEAHGQEKPQ